MKQLTAELTCSSFHPASFPRDRLPEIAFAGRSNVGKSSLINVLLGGRRLAHTSNTPGKTTGINFYKVNRSFYFVDLPGYGFSKVSKSLRENWKKLIADYLGNRETLLLTCLLIDSRMPPTELDLQMRDWLVAGSNRLAVVATKADKLSRQRARLARERMEQDLGTQEVISCSARTGAGRDELLRLIFSFL